MRVLILPALGILYLAWSLRAAFQERPADPASPPLEWRLVAAIVGALAGWVMASTAYAPDATHKVVGLPLPVCHVVNRAGTWTDVTSPWFLPCLLLDILIFALLGQRLLQALWPRPRPVRARKR